MEIGRREFLRAAATAAGVGVAGHYGFIPKLSASERTQPAATPLPEGELVSPHSLELMTVPAVEPGEEINERQITGRGTIARIEVSLSTCELTAYAADGAVLGTYPVAIGSVDTPTPAGEFTVGTNDVWLDPNWYPPSGAHAVAPYRVNPNNPLGVAWIGLAGAPGAYGLHGTNDEVALGKGAAERDISNGCIRLPNQVAWTLAHAVGNGITTVRIVE